MPSSLIDVHTHIYPPSYLALLRSRKTVPYLYDDEAKPNLPPRLIILPSDDDESLPSIQRGRPMDSTFSSIHHKLQFMDRHSIACSVISLANPWLDFLAADEGLSWAQKINDELNAICEGTGGRLLSFGALPLSADLAVVVGEIQRLKTLPMMRGVIMGTGGIGSGMDDEELNKIWATLEETETVLFLHPHYGLPSEVFGPRAGDYGHVLPLSLGFPMETTIAFTRMYLSGLFDRFPRLKILLAHAGGAVPFLGGRVESCVHHERQFRDSNAKLGAPRRGLAEVLRTNVWLDAVTYSTAGVKAAVDTVGVDKVLFGTDHPFFPPLDRTVMQDWDSVTTNVQAVKGAYPAPKDQKHFDQIVVGNARALFKISNENLDTSIRESSDWKARR